MPLFNSAMVDRIRIGKITSAVGIKGEVKVYPYTDIPERFKQVREVVIDGKTVKVESARVMKNMAVVKLSGTDDRNAAEALRNKEILIERKSLWEVPENTYFIDDLEGLAVVDEEGAAVGTLTGVIQRSAQDLYEITKPDGKSFLIPAVREFVKNVDPEAGTVTVRLIEGIADL